MIGTVLKHRYEVAEKVGEGNLFTVYKCDDKIDNRPVAAKVLLPQYAANRLFAERILVEAQAMVGVSHPGIVEVYDCGEEDGTYYVIVEYVRGVDLKERIRRSAPFSLSTVVDIGVALCDVLHFAHRRGFVHGDLRPGNILVTPEGQIKLADFWVSNAIASSQTLRTNAMMRSVHYMSPELAEGRPAVPASDVYSLGIILFELLTGAVPFDGDTPIAIALKHAREPLPSLRALNPSIPKALEAAAAKALEKTPQERFRSAKAMLNALKSVRDALQLSKPITWPQPAEKSAPETEPEGAEAAEVRDEIEEAEPVLLSALRKTLLTIVGLITVLVVVMVVWAMTSPGEVTVPNLVGKSLEEAQAAVADKDIRLAIKSEQFNEEQPARTIYYTNPAAGRTIRARKSVLVWVSKGSKFATTPDVVKLTLEEAKNRVFDAGLNVGEVSQEYSDTIPAGNVMQQSPSSGTRLERGDPVKLVFSLGTKPREMPLGEQERGTELGTRSFDVKITVPKGPEDQKVEIVVLDDYGESAAYSDIAQPGDRIEQTVRGVGDKITVRIYINNKLVKEDRKW